MRIPFEVDDNLQSYRDAALATLRTHFKARNGDDALFAIAALQASFDQDKDVLDAFRHLRDQGRFPLFTNAFLAAQYKRRGMADLEASSLLRIIQASEVGSSTE